MYLFGRPSSYSYNYYRPTYSAPAPAPAPSFDFSSLLGKLSRLFLFFMGGGEDGIFSAYIQDTQLKYFSIHCISIIGNMWLAVGKVSGSSLDHTASRRLKSTYCCWCVTSIGRVMGLPWPMNRRNL